MKYESIHHLSKEAFRRSVGIERQWFNELVQVLTQAELAKQKHGRPSLSLENQLCLTLSYWREYRTFFYLGLTYGVRESNAYRIVNRVESRLAASGYLDLVKPHAEDKTPLAVSVILDASEVPIERSKKTKTPTTVVRGATTP